MPSGTHRHLKRIAAPISWGLKKSDGTFAIRPLPGGFPKNLCLPIKYVFEKFLKVAKTSKEIHYILQNKMKSLRYLYFITYMKDVSDFTVNHFKIK